MMSLLHIARLLVVATAVLEVHAGDAPVLGGGAYGGFSRHASEGEKMSVVAATHFGGDGCEEFNGCGELSDGTIVATGNAWGPRFPDRVPVTLLGSGHHSGQNAAPTMAKGGAYRADPLSKDMAGMVLLYTVSEAGIKARQAIRFDWGVASISVGTVTSDGTGVIIGGRCLPGFASAVAAARNHLELPSQASPDAKPKVGEDAYVMRLSPAGAIEWLVVLAGNGNPPEALFSDDQGNVYVDAHGLRRVSRNGAEITLVNAHSGTGTSRWLGIDPHDGSSFFGGDRNTHTHKEPYRQPFCYKFAPDGKPAATLWEPEPAAVGADAANMQSDSSIRAMGIDPLGNLLFSGWSDGGNSVLGCQPLDFKQGAIPGKGMGMTTAGMHAGSVCHLMRLDARTFAGKQHAIWMAYVPQFFFEEKNRGRPNGTAIKHLEVLAHGEVAVTGSAATGLIQTPNAFWNDPMLPDKHGGANISVFLPDLGNLIFSSYVPGVEDLVPARTRQGLVVVGRSRGNDDWVKPTASPSVKADQPFGGGTDGFLVLLRLPESAHAP